MNDLARHQKIVVLDYGSQYSQLICRRIREAQVYAELIPWDRADELLPGLQPQGIVLSGGPTSVYDSDAPTLPASVLESGAPVLGICYGLQLLVHALGGQVAPARAREYGSATVSVAEPGPGLNGTDDSAVALLAGLPATLQVWMSHGDRVERLPAGFVAIAHSAQFAARRHRARIASHLRPPVSSRGGPYAARRRHPGEFRQGHLRL